MKKLIILMAALLMTASAAFATYEAADGVGKTLGSGTTSLLVKGSKGVMVDFAADGTVGQGYVLGTYHASGTKTYGSSSGDTKIFFKDTTGVAIPTTVPTGSASASFNADGWTAL